MRRLILVVGILATASGACTAPSRDTSLVQVKLGFRPTAVINLALLLAVDAGRFRDAGLEVTLHPYGRADLLVAALESGQIDGSLGTPLDAVLGMVERGSDSRAFGVWYYDQSTPYDGFIVPNESPLKTVEDIDGLTVGANPSRQIKYFVSKMAPKATVQEFNSASPLLGLMSGDFAAAYVLEPAISEALESGRHRLLEAGSISRRLFGGRRVPAILSVLSERWMQSNTDAAATFVRVARDAYDGYSLEQSRPAVVALLAKREYGGFSRGVASRLAEPTFSLPEEMDLADWERFQRFLLEGGLVTAPVDASTLLLLPGADARDGRL